MRYSITAALVLVLSVPMAGVAWSDDGGRALAATCTGCHGTDGASSGPIPSIDGMEAARMASLLREFRDGKREATIMHQLAKGYTDAQIMALAQWFDARRR